MTSFSGQITIHELGEDFYDSVAPAKFNSVGVRYFDTALSDHLGLKLTPSQILQHFLEFKPLEGSLDTPLALRYHGHQFRHYNPDIGDGRGFLFAQCSVGEKLLDFGTKGSGTTPYSRRGDGRLTLLGGVREVLAANYLAAAGVATSRAFALIETDEALTRHDEPSPTRAGVLTRLSHSHIRFGTFQRHAFFERRDNLESLVAYCIRHFYPKAQDVYALFDAVVSAHADTTAGWMAAGYVHGVLNTDNMNITGESFDYGPYRVLPHFDPRFTAAYFDESGLYAFGRQPEAVAWNLAQLAQSLSLICDDGPLIKSLEDFGWRYQFAFNRKILARLGLVSKGLEADTEFIRQTFKYLQDSQTPWAEFWHDWQGGATRQEGAQLQNYDGAGEWLALLKTFDAEAGAPKSARPATLLYDEIGDIWQAITQDEDWSKFDAKNADFIRRIVAA